MGDNIFDIKSLTRALLVGSSLMSLTALSACVTPSGYNVSEIELQRFNAAARSNDRRAVEAFLRDFPSSSLVPALLELQSRSVLNQLSPAVIRSLPDATLAQLSRNVRAQLGLPAPAVTPTAAPVSAPISAFGSSGGGAGGGGGGRY